VSLRRVLCTAPACCLSLTSMHCTTVVHLPHQQPKVPPPLNAHTSMLLVPIQRIVDNPQKLAPNLERKGTVHFSAASRHGWRSFPSSLPPADYRPVQPRRWRPSHLQPVSSPRSGGESQVINLLLIIRMVFTASLQNKIFMLCPTQRARCQENPE